MKWLPVSMCLGKESSVRSNSPPVETLASGFSGDCKDEAIYTVLSLTFPGISFHGFCENQSFNATFVPNTF